MNIFKRVKPPLKTLYLDYENYATGFEHVVVESGGVLRIVWSDGTEVFVKDWSNAYTELGDEDEETE